MFLRVASWVQIVAAGVVFQEQFYKLQNSEMLIGAHRLTGKFAKPFERRRGARGQGLVEFALTLPLMLLLIAGLIEFGRMLSIYNSVSNAAREAARYGSVVGDPGNGAAYYFLDCTGMRDSAKRASAFAALTDPDITIVYDHGSGSSFGACAQGVQPSPSIANADRVVVTVTATYAPILPLLPISSRTFTFTAARSIFPNIFTGSVVCYTLTITATNGSVTPTSQDCAGGYMLNTVVTVSATPDTGYTFDSWSGDLSGSTNPTTITMSANRNVTANFTANCYTLTTSISPGGGGSVSASPTNSAGCAAGQYTYNESVSLTASPGTGYVFSNWSGDLTGSTNPGTLAMPAANAAVTANFAVVPCYTLTLTAGAGGTAGASPGLNCNTQYNSGTSVTLTATADPGYIFNNWTGSSTSSSNPLIVTMDSAKNYTANFTATPCYSLTTAVNGINPTGGSLGATGGSVAASPSPNCGGNYNSGTSITLTATPATGFGFTSWTGGVTGSANPTNFTITGNTSVTANFTANCYTLTKTVVPDTTSSPPAPSASGSINATLTGSPNGACAGANQYTYNTQLQLQAVPAANYSFSSWSGAVTGTSNPTPLTTPASNASVTARFNRNCVLAGSLSITPPGASSQKIQLDYTNYTAATRTLNTLNATWPDAGSNKFNKVYFGPSQDLIADPTDSTSPTTIPGPGMNWSLTFNRGIIDASSKTLVLEFNFSISGSFTVRADFDDGCTGTTVSFP